MGFRIERIIISNFRLVDKHELVYDFENCDAVILSGKNGYGKTTLFDAIELLLTGDIDHLYRIAGTNKNNELRQLAKTPDESIVVKGVFVNEENQHIEAERRISLSGNESSQLIVDGEPKADDELLLQLNTTRNLYQTGIYLSQIDSLSFLEKKYKTRDEMIASLVNLEKINRKVECLNQVSAKLNERVIEKLESYKIDIDEKRTELERIKKETDSLSLWGMENVKYVPLFHGKYDFDKEEIITNNAVPFESFVSPLRSIREFIEEYHTFKEILMKRDYTKLLNASKLAYKKLYYKEKSCFVAQNSNKISEYRKIIELNSMIAENGWVEPVDSFDILNLTDEIKGEYTALIQQLSSFNTSISSTEKSLFEIETAREKLLHMFRKGVNENILNTNQCPMCGTSFENIDDVFEECKRSLFKSITSLKEKKDDVYNLLRKFFLDRIIPVIQNYLEHNKMLYETYQALEDCQQVDASELEKLLTKLNVKFAIIGLDESIDPQRFEQEYNRTVDYISACLNVEVKPISDEKMVLYSSVYEKYYNSTSPIHNVKEIDDKLSYIATAYYNEDSQRIEKLEEELRRKEIQKDQYSTKSERMLEVYRHLQNAYSDSLMDYKEKIVTSIQLPVLIYSGKILQNIPLGLGIRAHIKKHQIVFEAFDKPEEDVLDILSAGQLNGLAIAIMLAVHTVFVPKDGLNALLIDDPLQSVDDISAISLVDLLVNLDSTQLVVSTHETRKEDMIKYKYRKCGKKCHVIDVQEKYLSYLKHKNNVSD